MWVMYLFESAQKGHLNFSTWTHTLYVLNLKKVYSYKTSARSSYFLPRVRRSRPRRWRRRRYAGHGLGAGRQPSQAYEAVPSSFTKMARRNSLTISKLQIHKSHVRRDPREIKFKFECWQTFGFSNWLTGSKCRKQSSRRRGSRHAVLFSVPIRSETSELTEMKGNERE